MEAKFVQRSYRLHHRGYDFTVSRSSFFRIQIPDHHGSRTRPARLSLAELRSRLSGIVSLRDGEGWARRKQKVGKGACSQYVIRVIYTSQEHRPVYNGARLLDSRDYASLS